MLIVNPCPCCQGNDVELTNGPDNEYQLLCYICGFSMKASFKDELVKRWNEHSSENSFHN